MNATRRIAELRNFTLSGDTSACAFTIMTADGGQYPFEIETAELGALVQWLVTAASVTGRNATLDGAPRDPESKSSVPIPMEGMGMALSDSPDKSLLVVRLYTFELAFEIPNTKLAGLAQNIQQTAALMAGDHMKRN